MPLTLTAFWTGADGTIAETRVEQELLLDVANANAAPILPATTTWNSLEGQPLRISVFAFDPDNPAFEAPIRRQPGGAAISQSAGTPTVSYKVSGLPLSARFDAETLEIVWTPGYDQAGRYQLRVIATDDGDGSGSPLTSELPLTILVDNANRAPIIGELANVVVDKGSVLEIPVSARDADGRAGSSPIQLGFAGLPRFASYLPRNGGATGETAGVLRFTPGDGDRGDYTISVTASDDGDGDPGQVLSEVSSFVLGVRSPSEPPRLAAPQQVVAVAGQPLALTLRASDADQDPLTWSVQGLPPGATLTAGSPYGEATLDWTPSSDDLGRHEVELQIADSGLPPRDAGYPIPDHPLPNVTRHRLQIVVRQQNRAPQPLGFKVEGDSLADRDEVLRLTAGEGVPLSLEVFGSDADADPIDWQVDGLPRGMTATATGESVALVWTPDRFAAQDGNTGEGASGAGHWRFSVSGSDGMARFTRQVELVVANANQPPQLLPMPLQLVREGETLGFTVRATDPDNEAVRLSLLYDETTPSEVHFDAASGFFEWTPNADVVDNAGIDSRSFSFAFRASDGRTETRQTVEVRVLDVNRAPQLSAGNHAVVIGETLSLPVVFGDTGSADMAGIIPIVVADPDGAAQTAALTVGFANLPPGATYDSQTRRLTWTPGPGQIGDHRVTARVFDGRTADDPRSAQSFVLRALASAGANAPTILVSTTPDQPAAPGQLVIASVRAEALSGIARLAAELRSDESEAWRSVAIDTAGRLRLTPERPGLLDLRVSATDHDGFVASSTHSLRVRDPADAQAPQLAWRGPLSGQVAGSAPLEVRVPLALTAELRETQLMGWRLQISSVASEHWMTLAEQDSRAVAIDRPVTLVSLDPATLANGLWRLRLSAWDLAGRRSEIEARIIIETGSKLPPATVVSDGTYRLGGHPLALTRSLPALAAPPATSDGAPGWSGDLGNWQLPLLATRLSSDQPATLASGASAAWLDGARVWLNVPASLSDGAAGQLALSFTLAATSERLGGDPSAPLIWRPTFNGSQGWQLETRATAGSSSPDSLVRQGDRLYDQITGLPWVPAAYTLVSPGGDRYRLDGQGRLERVDFADGAQWLVSDAGVAALATDGGPAGRLDLVRDSSGRISRVSAVTVDRDEAASIVYRYDSRGRLALVRQLDRADAGTPYGYDAQDRLLTDRLTANLGTPADWDGVTRVWRGELDAGAVLGFGIRDSEIASTAHFPGDRGALIVAVESRADDANATIECVGARIIGDRQSNGTRTTLLLIDQAGLKLLRLSGTGQASVRLQVAGDVNRDGRVDANDSTLWDAALAVLDEQADVNGDGTDDHLDRQILFANSGFSANRAPAMSSSAPLVTHTDLATSQDLARLAADPDGDPVFWRILGATHGNAQLSADGQTLLFHPAAGFSGPASVTLQADDGYGASPPFAVAVNVSGARLTAIHLAPLATLHAGQTARLQATLDFEDQTGVTLADTAYLSLQAADLASMGDVGGSPLQVDDELDQVRATGVGPALLLVSRKDLDGRQLQTVAAINTQPAVLTAQAGDEQAAAPGVEPDVYPGSLTLVPGATRQLKVRLLDPVSGEQTEVHTASQIAFAGLPETVETFVDPLTQQPLIDPNTGDFVIDPATGDIVLDPNTGETVSWIVPAVPEVRNGTRYLISDERVASVSQDGLITARQAGRAFLSVVHFVNVVDDFGDISARVIGQTDVAVLVEAAQTIDDDPATPMPTGSTITAGHGGVVQAATGEMVMIGAGVLPRDTVVSIRPIELARLAAETGLSAPEPGILRPLAAFHLELGEQTTRAPVQLAIPLQGSTDLRDGDEVLFLRRGLAPASNGQLQDVWWILDNGFVGTDASGRPVARTASPPYSGISGSGDLICVKTTFDRQSGAITIKGSGVDLLALRINQLAFPIGGDLANGGLGGTAALTGIITSLAGASDIYAINRDFAGVYQTVPLHRDLANGDLGLTLEAPHGAVNGNDHSPHVTQVESLASGKLRLTIEHLPPLTAANALPAALRIWVSPEPLRIDQDGRATSAQWSDDSQPDDNGMLLWQKLVELQPIATGAEHMTVELELPEQVATGLHTISVQRMVETLDPNDPGRTRWLASGEAAEVSVAAQTGFTVVTGETLIRIFKDGSLVRELSYRGMDGTSTSSGSNKTDPVAFSLDNRLMFIAGNQGEIHVLDTATLKFAQSFKVGTANLSSLAVSGQWLYVAEGGYHDPAGGYRLLRVNIDPMDSRFLDVQQVRLPAAVSGTNAPYGYIDLAITPGVHSYLAVTASQQSLGISTDDTATSGGLVFIVDLDVAREAGGRLDASEAAACLPVSMPAGQGKAPQFVASAGIREHTLRFILSDAQDANAGFATVTVDISEQGRLQGTPRFNRVPMLGARNDQSRTDNPYQLNIQRAQSPALVTAQNGTEYALVADYFFDFLDPLYANDDQHNGGRQMGGKIGIIRDPFGPQPEYLGATSPIIGASISRLLVGADGSNLWADLRYWPTIDSAPPPSGLLRWAVEPLLAAAERNSLARQTSPRPLPIDRERVGETIDLVVTPVKYDLGDASRITSGWITGMADSMLRTPDSVEFAAPVDGGRFLRTIEPDSGYQVPEFNYGDIVRVDLFKLIRSQYRSALSEVKNNDLNINWSSIEVEGSATLVRDARGFLLTAEREDGLQSVEAAVRATYPGLQTVAGDVGKKTLSNSGIVFLRPVLDLDRLRRGEALKTGEVTIFVAGFDKNKPDDRLALKLRAVDYSRAADTVFFGDRPLNNPGYHEFRLDGSMGGDKSNDNKLLDVTRVEQRLKYLGYGLSAIPNSAEITVDGTLDQRELIALRQFGQIVDNKSEYQDSTSETVKDKKGKTQTISKPLPPLTLSTNDIAWLNAYNAPHWMQYRFGNGSGLSGWVNKTDPRKPTDAMGTSWIGDLMVASQDANKTVDGKTRPPLWFAGTNRLGNQLNLGINTAYVSAENQKSMYGDEWLIGLSNVNSVDLASITASNANGAAAEQKLKYLLEENTRLQQLPGNGTWDAQKAQQLAELLQYINRVKPADKSPNNQADALKDFFAVYTATQNDSVTGNGSLDEQLLAIKSASSAELKRSVQHALFGAGSQVDGLIDPNNLLLGGVGTKGVGFGYELTAESLGAIMGAPAAQLMDWVAPMNQALAKFDINTAKRLAAFLVNARFEAFFDKDLVENRTDQSAEAAYGNRYGNDNPGDGARYKGRGILQITFKWGYEMLGEGGYRGWTHKRLPPHTPEANKVPGLNEILGTRYDFVQNPNDMVADKRIAALSGGWYWRFGAPPVDGDLNRIIDRVGKAEKDNFELVTMGIKGHGNSTKDQKNRQSRLGYWNVINTETLKNQNSYGNIQNTLKQLGLSTKNQSDYHTKFGISLAKRQAVQIEQSEKLEAEFFATEGPPDVTALQRKQSKFPMSAEGVSMFVLDPIIQDQNPPQNVVLLAESNSRKSTLISQIAICVISPTHEQIQAIDDRHSISKSISPRMDAENHFAPKDNKWLGFIPEFTDEQNLSKVDVLEGPKHGTLVAYLRGVVSDFPAGSSVSYVPSPGYVGKDRITVLVTGNKGRSIVFSYFINVTPAAGNYELYKADGYRKYCPNGKLIWKISRLSSSVAPDTLSTLGSSVVSPVLTRANGTASHFAELSGSALGQTTGTGPDTRITLSPDAAGHGWFVDPTPWLDEEFLPTSNPNEWIARPGSAAESRIDLLTVLLHEYAHTLGIEHSADPHHLMAATLQPGVRRTLSIDDQLAMLRLAGHFPAPESPGTPYIPANPGASLPLTRVYGAARTHAAAEPAITMNPVPQYDIAAHPRLHNPEFTEGIGWSTAGDVSFTEGSATLAESPGTQTRLNQVFVLGEKDRFLSFTLADLELGDQTRGPDDAFEVALIDANNGRSLLGGSGLTRSDAAVNRQADGSDYRANGISVTRHADGSYRYSLDLRDIPAGTTLNLSFDLIGFGSSAGDGHEVRNSRLTLRDLRIGSDRQALQARDDEAGSTEDNAVQIDVLANDLDADRPGVVPVLLDGPAHGELVVNDDRTFTYHPAANWHGEDAFSYFLSDGALHSDPATVHLSVSPQADAPRLIVGDAAGSSREIFRTGWESVGNPDSTATLVGEDELEGWRLVRAPEANPGGVHGFEIWSSGDYLADSPGSMARMQAAVDNGGSNWLELNDAAGNRLQTLAIERSFDTFAGARYTLSLDLAGRPGFSADYTRITASIDGREIGSKSGLSPRDLLAWQTSGFAFVGTGSRQTIRIASAAARWATDGRGMMIDNLALSETLPPNTGLEDTPIRLSPISATLLDSDGSETLALGITGLPAGAALSDGNHRFIATITEQAADITVWNLDALWLTPPADYHGSFTLGVVATASEPDSRSQASSTAKLQLQVLPDNGAPATHDALWTLNASERQIVDPAALAADANGDHLTSSASGPDHGALTTNSTATWSDLPQHGYSGGDRIRHTIPEGRRTATAGADLTGTSARQPVREALQQPTATSQTLADRWKLSQPSGNSGSMPSVTADQNLQTDHAVWARTNSEAGRETLQLKHPPASGPGVRNDLLTSPRGAKPGHSPLHEPDTAPPSAGHKRGAPGDPQRHAVATGRRIDWSATQPACFSVTPIVQAAWLPGFLGATPKENPPATWRDLRIRIEN
ncbi:Ig-like domain-containing protein [Accumulibacter sp.]|uniref:Ig-like domain-containing protein n=1 Tax=Accumulibacter sp. TaxID=2053492 RepID=UPI0025C372A9|nr:Ig-like domain-containing protein [Accumulibacter sp.]